MGSSCRGQESEPEVEVEVESISLLGAAGEAAGLGRLLKANTSKKRTLSLFRQGLRWFELIPNMPASRLRKLIVEFDRIVRQHDLFAGLLASNPR